MSMIINSTAPPLDAATTVPLNHLRREGSHVVPLLLSNGRQIRAGRLVGLQHISDDAVVASASKNGTGSSTSNTTTITHQRHVGNFQFYNSVASFLAYKHFNERRGDVMPDLPALLDSCDFYFWTFDFRDTRGSGFEAVRQLAMATGVLRNQANATFNMPSSTSIVPEEPFAIFGAHWSSESRLTSTLSGSSETPQISATSTSADLNENLYFARTVATNDGDAHAAILYYRSLSVTHLACLYIIDSWGINYQASLQKYALHYNISLVSFPYDACCVDNVMGHLANTRMGHVFAIMDDWKKVLSSAYQHGIVGRPEYAWMGAEEKKWTGKGFSVMESHLAQALHGIGTLNVYFEPVPALDEALAEISWNKELQQEFVSIQADPTLFDGFDFPPYDPTGFTNSIFDAVMALGLTACNVSSTTPENDASITANNSNSTSHGLPPLFTGPEFYQKLVETTSFEGVSGHVSFDPMTGTRNQNGMRYSVEYILVSDEHTADGAYLFQSTLATVIGGDQQIDHRAPFVYFDNTTNVPPALPPIEGGMELNLLSPGAQAVGYALASMVVAASLGFLFWTIRNRNIVVVRLSQPIFLGQLCIGTLVTSLSVFPASLPGASTSQGPDRGMDMACASQMWLVSLGFVTAFSAVFSKTYRLNQLMKSGMSMRRIKVNARDVMWPFALLMLVNVSMLICVTLVAPYRYQRVPMESYDQFGRSTESFGTCRPDNNLFNVFVGILLGVNSIGVLVALYQAWKARNLPTEMSESHYLAMSLASFTETLLIGGPILIVMYENPTAWYLMSSIVLCVGCMTFLLPLMLPKYYARHTFGSGVVIAGRAMNRSRMMISGLDSGVADSNRSGGFRGSSSSLGLRSGMMCIRRPSDSVAHDHDHDPGVSTRGRSNRPLSQASGWSRFLRRSSRKDSGRFPVDVGSTPDDDVFTQHQHEKDTQDHTIDDRTSRPVVHD